MSDKETLAVYASQAATYADLVRSVGVDKRLERFAHSLPPGGRVLDWGCGSGESAAHLHAQGFEVTATDASPEFAALVETNHGLPVRVETFDALDEVGTYDGVWASFSLLHARKAALPGHLAQAHRALKPGGQFAIGMKLGEGEARDEIGRFYAYYTEDELTALLHQAGFTVTGRDGGKTLGLDGAVWPWVGLFAHA